jgi:hypothetical protein
MALLHLAVVAAAACLATAEARAEARERKGADIRFVPAGGSGTVSLGIYDRDGRLVRVLCDEWPFGRFHVGLNALSTTWDGLDDAGQPVPEGTYAARGFVVGDIGLEGEAVRFNDWIEGADSPRIASVGDPQLLAGGDILFLARLAGNQGALVRYSPESEARWRTVVSEPRPEPAHRVQLAVSDTLAFVLLDKKLRAADLADGAEIPAPVAAADAVGVAARGNRLALLGAEAVRFYALPEFAPQGEAKDFPAGFVSLALLDQGAVAAADDGTVWRWQAGWSKLETPPGSIIRAVSAGRENTFWMLEERNDGSTLVAHCSPEEGRLAEWAPEPGSGRLVAIAGTPEKDYFVATLASPEAQRTVAIRRKDTGEGWEYVFDKKITRCAEFGWVDGALSASGGECPQEITVRLVENPLDPGASRELTLQAALRNGGTVLQTTDGLPLLRVSDQTGFRRVMLVTGPTENTARFFQGDGACVEEYALSGLGDITSFDAGTIKMSGGSEAAPPPPADEEIQAVP